MNISSKENLRSRFVTGAVPTQQDFADFINAYIGSVNGEMPDEIGNIEVPLSYRVVPMFNPSTPPSSFDKGTSVLVFNYDPAENSDWAALLGPDVTAGQQFVVTQAYPDEGVFVQQVDTSRDGTLDFNLTRVNVEGSDSEWGPFVNTKSILSINGEKADRSGNVELNFYTQEQTDQAIAEAGTKGIKIDGSATTVETLPNASSNSGKTYIVNGVIYVSDGTNWNEQGSIKGDSGDPGPRGPTGLNGSDGVDGKDGKDGKNGEDGNPGEVGPRGLPGDEGPRGPQGEGVNIGMTYTSYADMIADNDNIDNNTLVFINSGPGQPNNGELYTKTNGTLNLSGVLEGIMGPEGLRGPKGDPGSIRLIKNIVGISKEDAEGDLPSSALVGDAVWVNAPDFKALYIWTDDLTVISEPGWLIGPNLIGPRGQGIDNVGTAELLTNAQTFREAINEVFLRGNNVKSDTVAALLSKNPNAGVTVDSSWEEIEQAIRDLPSGGTVVGREVNYRWLQPDNLNFGDFVKFYTDGLNAQDADSHQISNSYFDSASSAFMLPIGKNRLITFCSVNGTNSNLGVRIVEVNNKKITPLGTYRTVNNTTYSGYYSNAIMMNDTKGIYSCTFGTNFGLHLRNFVINGNEFETPTAGTDVINFNGAGMGAVLTRLSEDRFMVHSKDNGTLTRRIYSFNNSVNTFALISNTSLKADTGVLRDKIQVVPIKEENGKLVYAIKFIDTANFAMAYAIYSLDITTLGVTVIHPISNVIPPTGSVANSGKHATMHLWDYNGVKKLIFFHPNSGSNYRLTYTEIELDAVTSIPKEETLSSVQVSSVNNSGGNSNNIGTYNFHNEYFISPYEMVVAFSNNTNAYSVVLNLLTRTTSDEITLRTGSNSSTHAFSVKTNDNQFVFGLTNGTSSNNARPYKVYAFNPFNHIRKAFDGDAILGVTTSPSVYPDQVGVTRPPLT